jgi:hypothetical protein
VLYELYNGFGVAGVEFPGRQVLAQFGYDPSAYISTANLAVYPYTNQAAITARWFGDADLVSATDDDNAGAVNPSVLNQTILNVTRSINGLIDSCYPIPLMQTGTVAVIRVTSVSDDGLGKITSIEVEQAGNYAVAPATPNPPVYIRHADGDLNREFWGPDCWKPRGNGASLTAVFASSDILQGDGSNVKSYSVTGTPAITEPGLDYRLGDRLILVGGASFVPDKISDAATLLCCYELMRRRLTPQEQNQFATDAKLVKEQLLKIGNGELALDGTYKRFFSAATAIGERSVLNGANSL